MFRIGAVSDSHGDIYAVKRAISQMGDVDIIIHLGDHFRDAQMAAKEIKRNICYIRGNCDFGSSVECDRIFAAENTKILITHGHRYNVKSDYLDIYIKARQEEVGLVLFGHTHFAEVFEKDNIVFVNPGSVSRPRGGLATFAVVTIDKGRIAPHIMELL